MTDPGRRLRGVSGSEFGMRGVLNDSTRLYLEVILTAFPPDYLPNPLEPGGFSHKGYGDLSSVVGLGSLPPSLSLL